MTSMTLAVPNEIKTRMEHFPEINWSEVARQAFRQKLQDLELLERIKSGSELTDEDARTLGRDLNIKLSKYFST